ncbi:MAG TPA: hypothetical protein VF401_03700 [Candidatus Saccharimonadales bacterium]
MRRFLITTFALLGLIGLAGMNTQPVAALEPVHVVASLKSDACAGIDQVGSSQDCSTNGSAVTDLIANIVSLISYIAGIIAIIMIIISGMRFITSGGDAGKVSGAKNALVYALVGVAVAALAQFLVHFVINQAVK